MHGTLKHARNLPEILNKGLKLLVTRLIILSPQD